MNEWISVNEKLPKHHETILSFSKKGQCVCVFVDTKEMNKELFSRGLPIDPTSTLYRFCSQEIKGNVLRNVTHWMPLPEPPSEDK